MEPTRPDYRILLSRLVDSGQWDRALATAREWLAADPENPDANLVAGQALINLKRHAEAEPHLAKTLAGDPENALAHRFLSLVQFHQKRFSAAEASIQKALALNPEDAYHWYHLAWMLHRHGQPAQAKKYAQKARELAPRDSDIVNLLALCTIGSPADDAFRRQQYLEALELDPANPAVHNNLGNYYLAIEQDHRQAEECFRRALFLNPSLKTARANLFAAITRRDPVYRLLCAPRDRSVQVFAFVCRKRLLFFLLLPLWLVVLEILFVVLILWGLLVWPLVKAYEYLTLGDIRAQAGELGPRRGGLLGYRRWPLKIRLGLFALLLGAFWGILVWLIFGRHQSLGELLDAALAIGFGILMPVGMYQMVREARAQRRLRQSTQKIDPLLSPEKPRKK